MAVMALLGVARRGVALMAPWQGTWNRLLALKPWRLSRKHGLSQLFPGLVTFG